MIVPMKKVSLIIRGEQRKEALKVLRSLGIMHIEITEGSGEQLENLRSRLALLESAIFAVGKPKKEAQKEVSTAEALDAARRLAELGDEKQQCLAERTALEAELERLKGWGDIDPESVTALAEKGVALAFYEMPKKEYQALPDTVKTVRLSETKSAVRFCMAEPGAEEESALALQDYRFSLPKTSTQQMRGRLTELEAQIKAIDKETAGFAGYAGSLKKAVSAVEKEIEFETYATGMAEEALSPEGEHAVSVACFTGYIEADNLEQLKRSAAANSWGLLAQEPTEEDDVPTKLKNNKFVSLIYPLTDFLGTVPGYFEYDISGWFLAFILIFFGIIFGDGGYGLLITAAAALLLVKQKKAKGKVSSAVLLIGLFGLSTIVWGTLTCTWFGLTPEQLPGWLKSLSVPVISNVYEDTLWTLPWTAAGVGLTTAQNLQIFCFTLALIQLTAAHVIVAIRNRKSIKILGDIGSILQLFGIFYVVLSLVVNSEVFGLGLVVGGFPIGKTAILLVAVGFALSFVFANYEGSVLKSILDSLINIVSVLLGVVNVFSDIVSYIRLWAVGLAGAAISATVNELAGPLFGHFLFMIVAIVLLVFGHGLNMILNVLSVIVHGIRLNTLEFSSHLGMSWSGHKFEPFEE